jgi:hypothetical protein
MGNSFRVFTIAASGGTLYSLSGGEIRAGGEAAEACTRWAVPDAPADGSNPGPCHIKVHDVLPITTSTRL